MNIMVGMRIIIIPVRAISSMITGVTAIAGMIGIAIIGKSAVGGHMIAARTGGAISAAVMDITVISAGETGGEIASGSKAITGVMTPVTTPATTPVMIPVTTDVATEETVKVVAKDMAKTLHP